MSIRIRGDIIFGRWINAHLAALVFWYLMNYYRTSAVVRRNPAMDSRLVQKKVMLTCQVSYSRYINRKTKCQNSGFNFICYHPRGHQSSDPCWCGGSIKCSKRGHWWPICYMYTTVSLPADNQASKEEWISKVKLWFKHHRNAVTPNFQYYSTGSQMFFLAIALFVHPFVCLFF